MTDVIANLEEYYAQRLAEKATAWQVKHPEEAKQLRDAVASQFGKVEPEPGSLAWMTLEAAVVEAIRVKKGWPTLRQFVRLQAGEEVTPPTYVPPKIRAESKPLPADRKAAAAGDR